MTFSTFVGICTIVNTVITIITFVLDICDRNIAKKENEPSVAETTH